jgi:hypothetical protein
MKILGPSLEEFIESRIELGKTISYEFHVYLCK